ncbi:MAG: tetratricopeptide repeat protein [Gemmatimonadetes bacterium]|nr:tetratricopeptide repeat protein [Gemmatimonadota bacterium]
MSESSPTPRPPRKPRRRWRWHVPPALMHGAEQLEGGEILVEMEGAQAFVMFQLARDITLWGSADPDERRPDPEAAGAEVHSAERANFFTPDAYPRLIEQLEAAGFDAAVDAPLCAAAEVLRAPGEVTRAQLTAACLAVSEWADERELLGTALAFAQAGAIASPRDPAMGYRVGLLARRRAEYPRAESWFRRVIGLGRQAKDWESYANAFRGLANLYIQRGSYPAARRFLIRCLRAARRHGLRELQAKTYHDLFAIAVQTDQFGEANDLARLAFRAYGPRHPRLPVLASDIGLLWLLRGEFAAALDVLRAAHPHISHPCERLLSWGNIARAAGGAGDRATYDEAWDEIWSYAGDWHNRENAPWALMDAARGATTLGDWARAERAATTAREIAVRRKEAHVLAEADSVLDSVTRRLQMDQAATTSTDAAVLELASDLTRYLRGKAAVE